MNKLNSNKSGAIFFGAVLALFVFQFIVLFSSAKENIVTWIFAFGSQIIFGVSVIIGCKVYKINFVEVSGLKQKLTLFESLLVVLLAVFSIAAFLPLATVVQKLLRAIGYTYTPQYGDYVSTNKLFVLGIFGIGLFPAIGEELLFRANLVTGFKNRGYIFAILMSALMFALMHGNPTQLVHQFLIGIVMAYLFLLTRSFYAPFIFHFTNNFVAIFINLLANRTEIGKQLDDILAMQTTNSKICMAIVSIAGVILLIVTIVYITNIRIKKREKIEHLSFKESVRPIKTKGINAFFLYFDRNYNEPLPNLQTKDELSTGFFAGLGLILVIWVINLFVV